MHTQISLRYIIFSLLLFSGFSHAEVSSDASRVVGVYWFPDKTGQVEIYEHEDGYVGKVIAYDIEDQLDVQNPDSSRRGQAFVGSLMFEGFNYNIKSKRWEDGTIYDASEGKTYKARLWFDKRDYSVLKGRGYIGVPILGRTEDFVRVDTATQ